MNSCCLVFGSYVNAYGVISELYFRGVRNIVSFDYEKRLVCHSNKILKFIRIEKSEESLYSNLLNLNKEYDYIILFPTDDLQLEMLFNLETKIKHFCFIPFNSKNIMNALDKSFQYKTCKRIGVPFPAHILIKTAVDYNSIPVKISFPIILRPIKRDDIKDKDIPRNIKLFSKEDWQSNTFRFLSLLNKQTFVASEILPRTGILYSYMCYRTKNGNITNEWVGHKLSQHPDDFGVCSSAINYAPYQIMDQGRKLINSLDVRGISQSEFMFDEKSKSFKLIEVNLRSHLWNKMGPLTGVYPHYAMYQDAIGIIPEDRSQLLSFPKIHWCYFKHEILNLIRRKNYYKTFKRNLFSSDKICFAIFDRKDLKPFFFDLLDTFKRVIKVIVEIRFGFKRSN